MRKRIQAWIRTLQSYAGRWWYGPLIALLAFLDLFLLVIPTDGLLVSAAMLAPRRWIPTFLLVSLGSAAGTFVLAWVIQELGLPFLLQLRPGLDQTGTWLWTKNLMDQWGTWGLFAVALSPFMQHPAVALAALSGMRPAWIFLVVIAARILKYGMLAWLAQAAPEFLGRLWGIQGELEEAGVRKDGS